MEVFGVAPLRVGSRVWQPEPGSFALTVVCKATYRLCPGESVLAAEPEPLRHEDEPWDGDAAQSLHAPSDLAPRKARADVMLVGHAFAPRGEPVRTLAVRLVVGPVDKEIEICAERWWTRDGQLRDDGRFASMALRYERAAGGPGTDNPRGIRTGSAALADGHGAVHLPNLQPAGGTPESRRATVEPVGFGPIPSEWPARRARLGRHATDWIDASALDGPLPADLDYAYFNAAPPDQQVPLLRDGERLILQNLHRDHPRLITSLPAARPRAFAERDGVPVRDVGLRCDTLWIDTDRALCTLTWRGQIALATRDESGRVLVALEPPGERFRYEDVLDLLGPAEPPTLPPPALAVLAPSPPKPSSIHPPAVVEIPPDAPRGVGSVTDAEPVNAASFLLSTARVPIFQPSPEALPFARDAGPSVLAKAEDPPPRPPRRDTVLAVRGAKAAVQGPSWLRPAATLSPQASRSPSAPPPPAAPRFGEPPPLIAHPRPPRESTPPPVLTGAPALDPKGPMGAHEGTSSVPPAVPLPPTKGLSRSVTAVMEAPPPALPQLPFTVRQALDLIWVDPGAAARLHAGFPDLLVDLAPSAEGHPEGVRLERLEAAAVRVLVSGRHGDAAGIEAAMARAVGPDGRFRPPLVLLAGDLRFPFDELAAQALPPDYRGASAERLLLERRAYQRRAVLGGDHLRGLLTLPGGKAPYPVYLPEALARMVPMFSVLEVRLVAAIHTAQDQAEAHAVALAALAIGRMVDLGRGGAMDVIRRREAAEITKRGERPPPAG